MKIAAIQHRRSQPGLVHLAFLEPHVLTPKLGCYHPGHPAPGEHDPLEPGPRQDRAGQLALDERHVEQPQVGQLQPGQPKACEP